ncbi:MAG: N-6 DNA methylase [Candidatus Binataceae bacterium]
MNPINVIASSFGEEVVKLFRAASTREETYYPHIKDLWSKLFALRRLPFEVRTTTSERRDGSTGADYPDLAIYDRGDFVSLVAEVKLPGVEIAAIAASQDRDDQVGRYLNQTGVVIVANIRAFGLLACRPGYKRIPGVPVAPSDRVLLEVVDLWPSQEALRNEGPIPIEAMEKLADLLEQAVTEFAPISDPASLARILALQAVRAKEDLPKRFDAVAGLLEDYREALGLTFQEREGFDFFCSSLIQTAFYALFAGWTLWHRAKDGRVFEWERLDRYLRIPFLGKLFYEFRHPDRLAELGLAPHLDRAAATLGRVERDLFFSRFTYSQLDEDHNEDLSTSAAITYFYEPFLEAFDPDLRDRLGVWYTPREIVRYQVKKIDRLLRSELGCPRGFAESRVVVLDPCCGTGAYLLEVVRCIAKEIRARGDEALLGAEIGAAIASRIIGFEILTAPFVISHLQLYLMLDDLGTPPSARSRPAIFLTNALTGWGGPEQVKLNFPELQEEHDRAKSVKDEAKIIVILGNPPYYRFAGTALEEEQDLVDHYKGIRRRERRDRRGNVVRDENGAAVMVQYGESLLYKEWGVRKQLLDDLYIRFFRLAEKRIGEKADYGIVSYISNSSYLTGRSHPRMRESLVTNFHEVWIDNLHGNRLASERTPWGGSCETIFSSGGSSGNKVGVSVSTLLKRQDAASGPERTTIHYRDFWGKAADKRRALLESLEMGEWGDTKRREAAECRTPRGAAGI